MSRSIAGIGEPDSSGFARPTAGRDESRNYGMDISRPDCMRQGNVSFRTKDSHFF